MKLISIMEKKNPVTVTIIKKKRRENSLECWNPNQIHLSGDNIGSDTCGHLSIELPQYIKNWSFRKRILNVENQEF